MPENGWRAVRALIAAVAITMTVSCSASSPGAPPARPTTGTSTIDVGGRSVTVHVPGSYDSTRPAPLVILLHGYSSDGREQESYLGLTAESDRRGFVYAYPDGTVNERGNRFWNATDACCSFFDAPPDDSRYLSELITTLQSSYRTERVYLIGHSNGGFMAFRMACDHADQVTAIASLNGGSWNDTARCRPSEPVSVLAIHSSADETVAFGGGTLGRGTYPSAAATVAQWREYNRCGDTGQDAPPLDLVATLPAAETSVRTYALGCADGSTVQAWTISGGSHVPAFGPAFAPAVTDHLLAQVEPAR